MSSCGANCDTSPDQVKAISDDAKRDPETTSSCRANFDKGPDQVKAMRDDAMRKTAVEPCHNPLETVSVGDVRTN